MRLLGAIIPHDKDTWFFKLTGKLDAVGAYQKEFEDFVRSVRFDQGGEAITWRLPDGWERLAEDPERYATIRVGPKAAALELTVHRFGNAEQMRSVYQNVVRWGQREVGIPVREDDLRTYVQRDKTAEDKVPFYFVDMKGPGGSGGMVMNPSAAKLSYQTPDDWKPTSPIIRGFQYEAAFAVEGGALVTISKFPGQGGGLLSNANRWRDQIGLPPIAQDQLDQAVKSLAVDGTGADYVDFKGPGKKPTDGGEHILGVMVPRGIETWFIKMQGPAETVAKQKAAFEKFVGSVKFDGGNGG